MPKLKITSSNKQAELPYAGTSGWSGSDTSYERAVKDDTSGVTSKRQQDVILMLSTAGSYGLTWREVSEITEWHHGTSSGALSVLHKAGRIERLTEKRNGCKVYVLDIFVEGRETEKQGNKKRCPHCGGAL
jgi:hypothetical protein